MKSISRILGLVGLVCIGFGLGVGLYSGNFKDTYVLVNLGLGAVLAAIAAIVNAGDLKSGLTGRSTKLGVNAAIYAAAVLAILVLVNYLAARNQKRFDLTENKQYSLADATLSLLQGLDQPVKVTGFFLGGQAGPIEDLLESYDHAKPDMFDWEIVDPDKRPELAERYGVRQNATLVVERGEDRKTLANVNAATLEESLTNGILALTGSGKKTVCAVTGHGERDLDDADSERGFGSAKRALEGENFAVQPLMLATLAEVPADCTLVLIAGPERPYFESEVKLLDAYLAKGGSLYAMVEPQYAGPLLGLLEKWGAAAHDDIIVDEVVRLFEGQQLGIQPIVNTYDPEHPLTRGFAKQTIFTQARSIGAGTAPEGYAAVELAKTSNNSWGETGVDELFKTGQVQVDAKDRRGPVSVAVAVGPQGAEREGKAKLVVFGDADFANNRFITAFFNGDFFLNAANWLTDQEKQISIRPKGPRASFVRLTDAQMQPIFYLAVLILPQLLLTVGIIIAWRRR